MVLALFAWNVQPTMAQKPAVVVGDEPGWQKIGETIASFKSQDESISVIGADEFSAIKLKIGDAPLEIDRMQVFYESGEMEEIDVKQKINAGEESQIFRLQHPDRDIQKVAFTYNTVPNAEGEKADVELYGLNPEDDRESKAFREDAERAEEKAEEEVEERSEAAEREAERAEERIEERTDNTGDDVENAADRTGDAVSEAAAKAAAEIDDAKHDTKIGPAGQDIFISDDSRYYYISDEGKRVYVEEVQLKDKPEKK